MIEVIQMLKTKIIFSLFLLLLVLILVNCSTKKKPGIDFFHTHWSLQEIDGKSYVQPGDAEGIFIQFFEQDKLAKGFAGCNSFFGNFKWEKNKLKIGALGSTRMICPEADFENRFFALLGEIEAYEIVNKQLLLKTRSGTVLRFYPVIE